MAADGHGPSEGLGETGKDSRAARSWKRFTHATLRGWVACSFSRAVHSAGRRHIGERSSAGHVGGRGGPSMRALPGSLSSGLWVRKFSLRSWPTQNELSDIFVGLLVLLCLRHFSLSSHSFACWFWFSFWRIFFLAFFFGVARTEDERSWEREKHDQTILHEKT